MNRHSLIALAAFVMAFAAQAAEPAAATAKPQQPAPAAAPAKSVQTVPVVAPVAAQKTAAHSQQDKMRECNKQATGKKGPERKAFMKTCLSKKA